MRRFASVFVVTAGLILAGCSGTGDNPEQPAESSSPSESALVDTETFTPVVGSVLAAPIPVPGTDGATHLAYELVLSNALGQPVTIDSITVEGDGAQLLSLSGDDLSPWMKPLGAAANGTKLVPGQQATVILDVAIPSADEVPQTLSHVIEVSPDEAAPPNIQTSMTSTIAEVSVSDAEPVTIQSPLSGDRWLDGNSCCEVTPHRSAINPLNGELHVPERFAIDFVQLDEQERIFGGPKEDLASYAYYGSEILAVADGPIVSIVDDLPEQPPGTNPTGLMLEEYGGNHIVQDIGGGRYAFYAHLQGDNPVGVSVGQKLSQGDTIGLLGNSGNTDMPHLHFHIMDSPLPLASNGLPFVIESFTLRGTVPEDQLFACMADSVPCTREPAAGEKMTLKSPLYGDLLDFSAR